MAERDRNVPSNQFPFLAHGASLEMNLKDCLSYRENSIRSITWRRKNVKNNIVADQRQQTIENEVLREWQFPDEKYYTSLLFSYTTNVIDI